MAHQVLAGFINLSMGTYTHINLADLTNSISLGSSKENQASALDIDNVLSLCLSSQGQILDKSCNIMRQDRGSKAAADALKKNPEAFDIKGISGFGLIGAGDPVLRLHVSDVDAAQVRFIIRRMH